MNGVRQGGVLSGLLFSIYIDDLIDRVSESNYGCMLGISRSNIIVYADDIVILAPSRKALQVLLDICQTETRALELAFNTKKCKMLLFRPYSKRSNSNLMVPIKICDDSIEMVDTIKYLGFIISNDLGNDGDVDRALKKFYIEFNQILKKISFYREISKDLSI